MKKSDYPRLSNLLCAYFNQDWGLDFSSWKEVVELAARENPSGYRNDLVGEINMILEDGSERQLENYFKDVEAGIEPPYDAGMTHVMWLRTVQEMFRGSDLAR